MNLAVRSAELRRAVGVADPRASPTANSRPPSMAMFFWNWTRFSLRVAAPCTASWSCWSRRVTRRSEALRATTALPARWFGLGDRGRIAPGLRAGLLLVDGDPTVDLTATRAVRRVWIGGEPVAGAGSPA